METTMRRRQLIPALLASMLAPGLALGQSAGAPARVVILLIGPPGSGKGTQSKFITDNFGLPGVSTGELLRAEVQAATPLGREIQGILAQGTLVSDDIVNQLVAQRIAKPDAAGGFILDGYPRTVPQAGFLDKLLSERKFPRPTVLHLDVAEAVLMERLTQRGRADDKPEVIRDRMRVYEKETSPLISYYSGGDYHRLDGAPRPEEVYRGIDKIIRARRPRR
jgi:adenylate kinase